MIKYSKNATGHKMASILYSSHMFWFAGTWIVPFSIDNDAYVSGDPQNIFWEPQPEYIGQEVLLYSVY